jgi:hypothetical protein
MDDRPALLLRLLSLVYLAPGNAGLVPDAGHGLHSSLGAAATVLVVPGWAL